MAQWNLQRIGVIAIVFMCLEVGALVPVAIVLLHVRLQRILSGRLHRMAVLLSVPRALLLELSRREVVVGGAGEVEEDDEEDGEREALAKKAQQAQRASAKTIRALLSKKIDYDRVSGEHFVTRLTQCASSPSCILVHRERGGRCSLPTLSVGSRSSFANAFPRRPEASPSLAFISLFAVAREQLAKQRLKQRSARAIGMRITVPLALWGAVTAVIFGITWMLQVRGVAPRQSFLSMPLFRFFALLSTSFTSS